MNRLICFLYIIISILSLQEAVSQVKLSQKSTGMNYSNTVKSKSDSIQYALGAYVAKWIKQEGLNIKNLAQFNLGLNEYLNDISNKKISEQAITDLVAQSTYTSLKEKGALQEQRLFDSLKDKPYVGQLPNGVKYFVLKKGKGRQPQETDTLTLNILAKLPDNTVIENTYQNKQPVFNTPNNFFSGLKEALMMMNEGAKWQVYIPAKLAFGEKGNMPRIPPNSALVVEVEILSINKSN